MEAKEDIRAKLNIEDVIGEYVQLKRAGRNFKGLSPFSQEKTPSFMVSPDKHIWHDFSSNRGGDIFSFVMEVEGLDFRGALELLARKAGVDLSQYETKGDRGLSQKKEKLYKILDLAATFYQQNLLKNPHALEYVFKKRGLTKEVVQQFRIGYAPNMPDGLKKALTRRGYSDYDVRDAGLLSSRQGRQTDMFRGRMMVPLADGQGRVVGFTARLIEDQPNAPKYINTPQTLLYDKGRQVFGLHLAKEAIRKHDYVVLVEGNLDVISSHQAGVRQVVASAGTALTDYHLRSLSRLSANVRLAFDADKAGLAATERAIGIASNLGMQLGVVALPSEFKDPDEAIQADPAHWVRAIEAPLDALEWLIDEYAKRFDLRTAEGKRKTTTKVLEIIRSLADPVEQEHYLNVLAGRTNTSLQAVKDKLDKEHAPTKRLRAAPGLVKGSSDTAQDGGAGERTKSKKQSQEQNLHQYQDHLLGMALHYPALRDSLLKLEVGNFSGGLRQTLFLLIKKLETRPLTDDILEKLQSDELRVKIQELALIIEQKYDQLEDSLYFVASELSKRVLVSTKTKQKDDLAEQLNAATDPSERRAINQAYKKLVQEIEDLKR